MHYDPTQYLGSAVHYLAGRPPYSAQLATVLAEELRLDGSGRLVDVGCGPGVLAVELASLVADVIAVDPDAAMLHEARAHARANNVENITFVEARAEALPELELGPARLVTFGQSFHRTDRLPVAEAVYDLLGPGGAMALVVPDLDASPPPPSPGHPPIPDAEIQALIRFHLGEEPRSGAGLASRYGSERFEETLKRTRFGPLRTVHAPGRPDIVRGVDDVISRYLSMSYAAPHLFGDRLDAFLTDLRQLLESSTTTGRFWDWPGDTAVIIARKPAT
ncbi:MAG: class I SAM-dependent methyltransferase [Actinomycetota bacterium]